MMRATRSFSWSMRSKLIAVVAVSLLAMLGVCGLVLELAAEAVLAPEHRLPALGVGALVILGASLLIMRSITAPLRVLSDVSDRVIAGDRSAAVSVASDDELGAASDALAAVMGELAQARRELQEAARRHDLLSSAVAGVTWAVASDGTVGGVSANVERVLGFTVEEVVAAGAARWTGRVHPDDRIRVAAALERLFDRQRPFDVEYRVRRNDGGWIWVHDRALNVYERDGTRWAEGLCADVSARKRTEQALADSERRYRLVADNMTDVVWTCDLELRPTYVSPSVAELTGYRSEEILDKGFGLILSAESIASAAKLLTSALDAPAGPDGPPRVTLALHHIHRDGRLIPTEVEIGFVLDEHGGRAGVSGVTRDVSGRAADRPRGETVSGGRSARPARAASPPGSGSADGSGSTLPSPARSAQPAS